MNFDGIADKLGSSEELVNGKFYVRAAPQLTPKQLRSALDHLASARFDSAAVALMQVSHAQLHVAMQARRRTGLLYLHRLAVGVTAVIDGKPVIANSFSYRFFQVFTFMNDSDARVARITASRTRSTLVRGTDIYGAASDNREAQSFADADFDKVPEQDVDDPCFDLITELSSGRRHQWYLMTSDKAARRHALSLRDDNKVREIIDKYQRTGVATPAEKAEWRRIAGKVSFGDLGSVELSYDRASIPAGEPSITTEQAAKLLE